MEREGEDEGGRGIRDQFPGEGKERHPIKGDNVCIHLERCSTSFPPMSRQAESLTPTIPWVNLTRKCPKGCTLKSLGRTVEGGSWKSVFRVLFRFRVYYLCHYVKSF